MAYTHLFRRQLLLTGSCAYLGSTVFLAWQTERHQIHSLQERLANIQPESMIDTPLFSQISENKPFPQAPKFGFTDEHIVHKELNAYFLADKVVL